MSTRTIRFGTPAHAMNRVPSHDRLTEALRPGRHTLTMGELALLLKLDLIEPTGKTPDGRVVCYSLTGNGRILAQTAKVRA